MVYLFARFRRLPRSVQESGAQGEHQNSQIKVFQNGFFNYLDPCIFFYCRHKTILLSQGKNLYQILFNFHSGPFRILFILAQVRQLKIQSPLFSKCNIILHFHFKFNMLQIHTITPLHFSNVCQM